MNEQEIDRLKSRLQWEAGPLAAISSRSLDSAIAGVGAFTAWLRENAKERPLISLLVAFELGFAAGKWGAHHAQR